MQVCLLVVIVSGNMGAKRKGMGLQAPASPSYVLYLTFVVLNSMGHWDCFLSGHRYLTFSSYPFSKKDFISFYRKFLVKCSEDH